MDVKYLKDYPLMIFNGQNNHLNLMSLFIKKYDEGNYKEYFLKVDVKYPKKLFNLLSDLLFLPERKKIEKSKKT